MEGNQELNVKNDEEETRQELIDTAVKFLQNPKVINSPLAQKQKFLKRRGLTDKEIQLACVQSRAYDQHTQQHIDTFFSPTALQVQRSGLLSFFERFRDFVHSVAALSIVGYVLTKLYKTFIAPFLFGKKRKSIEDSIDDLNNEVKSSIDEIKDELSEVKVEVEKISQYSAARHLTEIKSELSTVKGLLLTRKQFPSVSSAPVEPPSIPAWQMTSVPTDGDPEEHQEEVGSGSGSSEPEHGMKTSESSLEIISSRDCDSESCHSKKSGREDKEDIEKE